jgi:hypothetical protein
MDASELSIVTDEPDWRDVLEAAGVIVRAESRDANGNVVFRVGRFPDGEEGERLRKLFDRNVKQAKP